MIFRSSARPSVRAAGPGCKISGDLISYTSWCWHSRGLRKALPRRNALGPNFLTAPRANDKIWRPLDHFLRPHDTVLSRALTSAISEDVDLDELRNPPNSRD